MRLPCEQFREKAVTTDEFTATSWCECGFTKGAHEIATLVRAEQAEALAAKDREIEQMTKDRDDFHTDYRLRSDEQSKAAIVRAERAEAQVSTLTARVQALAEKWEQATDTATRLETDNPSEQGAAWHRGFGEASSRAAADLRALLTQEPTP